MSRLKNVTLSSVTLQLFETLSPSVGGFEQSVVLVLKPGEDVDEALWLVSDNKDDSYNAHLIDSYIQKNILTRLLD